MSESFDPYHVWLGIPPESRPPTHYELLGISPNEHEKAVIEAAMLRQSGYVRNFQIGKYANDATKVLNEIAAAKTCLLDPAKRAKYDAELNARRPAVIQVPSQAPSIPSALAAVAPALDLDLLAATAAPPALRPSQRRRSTALTLNPRKRKASSIAWQLPAGIGISVCALLAALAFWPKSAQEPPQPQPNAVGTVVHTASVELDQAETEPRASQPQVDSAPAASPPPVASVPSGSLPISAATKAATPMNRAMDWSYGYARIERDAVSDFTPFPSFIDSTWRGGAGYPDPQLDWARLDARGGHPGTHYAVIRRWVSPAAGVVSVEGTLEHNKDDALTDGVRGRVITGRSGTKGEWRVRTGTVVTKVGMLSVAASESVDFVVDCLTQREYDSFEWPVTLELKGQDGTVIDTWDSVADFAGGENSASAPATPPTGPLPISAATKAATPRNRAMDWSYGYARIERDAVSNFTPFPSFFDSTWRGGAAHPDPQLDYAALDAPGGHPGFHHAVIRRWIAPLAGVVSVKGTLVHRLDCPETDGIRGRVITGRGGTKGEWRVRGSGAETEVAMLSVAAFESVDFVVDCLSQQICDAFKWPVTLKLEGQDGTVIDTWDSAADFGGPLRKLTPDQLAFVERHSNARTIDVLALIDPVRDGRSGKWAKDSDGVQSPRDSWHAVLRLPVAVPDEYSLTVVAERAEGWKGGQALAVGLLGMGRQFHSAIDWNGTSGLEQLDGKLALDNESTAHCGALFHDGNASVVTYTVRRSDIEMLFDGRQIFKWQGDFRRLRLYDGWKNPLNSPLRLFLATHCDWHFKAILLTPLTVVRSMPAAEEKAAIDLLKTIDLKKHTRGGWTFDGPVLVSPPNVVHAGVRFPGVVPDEYRLRIVAERPRGYQGPPQFHVGLVTRSSQATLVLDADHKSGLEAVGGRLYGGNATTFAGDLFIDGVDSTIDCTVRKDSIRVDFDGHTIIDWRGDLKQLSPTWTQFGAPKRAFWIGTHCNWRIKKVELLPLTKQ